mmetsp:Transcript_19803/g.43089  ORF Transcript_19803/g.43089 Transcript_19803/m.43089 type:complete len:409 (-) Transcript_19803:513-1739(-)
MSEEATPTPSSGSEEKEFVLNADGSILIDHNGKPVTVERFLCTKPLRAEVSTRRGPGGMKLTYMGGDMVTKTLNEAFGYNGWCLEVKNTSREEPIKDEKGRYHVAYIATVRVTHQRSGVFREDCGAGDSIDRSLASASGNALKGAVTDAMKRAARHFGEKLGNSLYHDGFNANNAPATLKDSLNTLDIDRAKSRFGFDKDRKMTAQNAGAAQTKVSNQPATMVKQEAKMAASNRAANSTKHSYAKQTPQTQYVGNVVIEHSNASTQPKTNPTKPPVKTPYVTPGNRPAKSNNKSSFDLSVYAAVPAEKLVNTGKENSNPQVHPSTAGLALPPRAGTSRGGALSPTSAYISHFSESKSTPSMFGANGAMSQALASEQTHPPSNIAQSLKRKSTSMDKTGSVAKKNPYNC